LDNKTWFDADEQPGIEVFEGHEVYYKFVVTNIGNVVLENITLNDSNYSITECVITNPLDLNDSFECIIGPYEAEVGLRTNTVTVEGEYDQALYNDSDPANYHGEATYTKGGTVFFDKDQDSQISSGDYGLPDVTVFICLECPLEEIAPCNTIAITMTDSNGYYEFNELPERNYSVSIPRYTDNPDDYNEILYEVYQDKVNYKESLNRSCLIFELTSDETDNNFPFIITSVGGIIEDYNPNENLEIMVIFLLPTLLIYLLTKSKIFQ
jgi:hypothetical protein